MDNCTCKYCGKIWKNENSKRTHERFCNLNPNREPRYLSNSGWSKGLTKDTDPRVKRMSEALKGKPSTFKGKTHSDSVKKAMSERAKQNKYEERFGKRKSFIYKDCSFGSSYEVKLAKILDEHDIKWVKPGRFPYHDSLGEIHHYTPDLYVPEYDIYFDPKNDFLIENVNPNMGYNDVEKITWVCQENHITVFILNKTQINWEYIKTILESKPIRE